MKIKKYVKLLTIFVLCIVLISVVVFFTKPKVKYPLNDCVTYFDSEARYQLVDVGNEYHLMDASIGKSLCSNIKYYLQQEEKVYLIYDKAICEDDTLRPDIVISCNPVLDCTKTFSYVSKQKSVQQQLTLLQRDVKKSSKILFIHGESDTVVPIADTEKMAQLLTQKGFSAEFKSLPNVNHAFILFDYKSTHEDVLGYLKYIDSYIDKMI